MKTIFIHIVQKLKDCISRNTRCNSSLGLVQKMWFSFGLFLIFSSISATVFGQAASSNYATQTGTLGTTYSWINCSGGTDIVSGDDAEGSFLWPFAFSFYDNTYTTANSLSVATNGFIRLDGTAGTDYSVASAYALASSSTELGQIIATSVFDCNVGGIGSSWVRYLLTGSAPNRILTIEYNDIEIDYNDNSYADVQVSFYETSNKVVLKFGADNVTQTGADMGIHSGVSGYFNNWQEVTSGTNDTWIEYTPTSTPTPPTGPAASWNYNTLTGTLGTTYSWINCTLPNIVTGDDAQATISWPFNFNFYDNSYTTANNISISTNGFIRFDGNAGTNYSAASAYNLTSTATSLGQIIGLGVYDGKVGDNGGWVRSLVTGTAPNRIFTIEYNNLEINYNANKYADIQVSFYETLNKIVLKFGADNVTQSGADMGIHSGVSGYFNKWQEVANGTNNTWIEYTPSNIEVNATIGTSLAYYPTLKDAFDKINDGTHKGNITVKIKSSTTESSSAILNASGTGSSNYSLVNIYPTATGLSISGNLATPLIDLNGADNVTIDGRVNASGSAKNLSIINSSAASTAGTSTIRFINGATNNTVKFCTVQGSETLATSGVLFFSDTNAGSGNNTNTIDNNNITNASNVNRPINAIYSMGTGGKENSGNIISNNAIYDFLKHGTASNGILLSSNTTSWTINTNSFYETTSFVPTAVVTYNAININNTAGNNFTISNNYIGGSAALCGGTPWAKTNASNNIFNAISLNVGSTTASSVQNNTIKNFSWGNSANADWSATAIAGGDVNIGTTTGNTIGATTGTGSVTVTGATSGLNVYGIAITGTGTVDCRNNTIGAVTSANGADLASNIYGIYKSATAGTTTISHNTIGSTATANSIYASSTSTANAQVVYGIYNAGTGVITIANNTISKINNGTTHASIYTRGVVHGITSKNGTITIANNTIYDLSIANANRSERIDATNNPSVCGMALSGTANAKTVTGNTIYNLSNSYDSFGGNVIGMYFIGGTSANVVSENFIQNLSVTGASSTAANIYGIKIATGVTTYSNNIINLGGDTKTTVYGIYETGAAGNNNNLYFNTVYIGGSLASGSTNKSYALYSDVSTNVRDFRNNIFMNARSTALGANLHYAAYFNYSVSTNITLNYNDYFVSGNGGVLAYWNGANRTSLPIITGQDANSLAINPNFATPGGTIFSDYYNASTLPGVFGTGILTDYEGITRNSTPKIGALESSLGFVWQGNTSTDFATVSNWLNGAVPPNGADISFAVTPANDCYLDQNRSLKNITNTSAKKFVVNGKQLTLTGNIISATANQIDATAASSVIVYVGTAAQSITSGTFVSNTIDGLTVNNSTGLTQNGAITIQNSLTLTNGAYRIGANTLTINGLVSTMAGTLIGGSTSNISIGGSGASTILPGVLLNNLTLNRSNGINLGGNLTIGGTLVLTSGTLVVGSNTLKITKNTPTRTNGKIDASNTNATINFSNPGGITLTTSLFLSEINNLTINGGGITVVENITVNGILNLQTSNPSATKGLLDMTLPNELIMGANAANDGGGDVTGIITRNTFLDNQKYTFGNKNTWLNFYSGATSLPDYMKLKVVIGNDLWGTGTVKRVYELIQANGNNYLATFRAFYLDPELNGNAEDELSFWAATFPFNAPVDNARSNSNVTENWVEISDFDLDYLPSTFGVFQISMDESNLSYQTWTGRIDSNWNDGRNWAVAPFPGTVPTPASFVVIPDAATTPNDPTLPPNATTELKTISLKPGSILNSGSSDNAQLSLNHNIGTWNNAGGTFNPGNSTVNFIYAGNTTISGTTTFNNIFIAETTALNMTASSYIKVAGGITINKVGLNSGEFRTKESGATTVEYNGANQTITNPINSAGNDGYYKLVLSGTGIKTMPATAMTITDEFVLRGALTATAQSALTIGNEFEVLGGATFNTGAYDHTVGGHFDVGGHLDAGTFTPTAGYTITLNGTTVQNIYGGSAINFENLIIDNSAGVEIFTDITVNGDLTLTNGNLNVGITSLSLNGGLVKTSGFLDVNSNSSLIFGGTTALTLPASLFFSSSTINNLTVNRTGGVIAGSDFTVNGILNLQSANPSATIGSFSTASYTLNMGATAATIGIGDVTGKIKRSTILPNIEYTFGNQFSSVTFPNIGTLPTEITLKVSIGTTPGWKADGINRIYDISQIGGSGTSAIIKSHYLDSELNGNNETNLSFFGYIFPSSTLLDRGLTEINTTENWLTLSNTNFGNLPSGFGIIEHGFGVSSSDVITWDGTESTDWFDPNNWTPAFIPSILKVAIIPDAATTPNDPLITANSTTIIKTLSIQSGGILNAGANSQLSINGSSGAWNNTGTFNAGTGKVLFNHGVPSEIATIAGSTDFYNIEVGPNSTLQPVAGNYLSIAGAGAADMTSIVDFSTVNNTVEWNGTNQTIVNPNGIGGSSGYYNLILSGSGTKTMPTSQMNISGDFGTSGTVNATAAGVLVVSGNTLIGNGSAFTTGSFNHLLAGNFENNGTFTGTAGGSITFNGTAAQTISGTSTTDFNNLTINNLLNVTQAANVNVNNVLLLNSGNLIVGNATLGINGTISNPSGAITGGSLSNLNFGGTSALTLNNNLFTGNPTINNLTINRSGGVTLGNQSMTINGTLALTAGTFTIGANTLTLAGNSTTRVSGNINAGNTSATLAFTNTAAITLPASVITGNINNLTVNGAGVNAGSDLTLIGILNLVSANQSATVGSLNMGAFTLNMGASATTTGTGDVTGIVRRQHTFLDGVEYSFGNQFTNLNFLNVSGSTKPTWVSCKIAIGTAPTWRSEAINRYYSFAQSGGTDRMIVKLHYLDSELHGTETDETQLVFWDAYDPALGVNNFVKVYPRNHNGTDATNNWVQLTGPAINYLATSSALDVKQWGLSYTNVAVHTWIGLGSVSYPGDWSLPGHWEGGVPGAGDVVLIPTSLPSGNSGYPYRNLLPVVSPAVAKSVEIQPAASLNSDGYNITVSGSGDAWVNNGTFIPGSGTITFNHGELDEVVNLNGTTNFNNLTVSSKTFLQAASGSITRIAGAFVSESGDSLDFSSNINTVEYNGSVAQNVVNEVAQASAGYYNLILSGSGTKTLPSNELKVYGNLTTNSAISATGNTLTFNGSAAQSITGTILPTLNNLTISNTTNPVSSSVNLTCSGDFINSGEFDITNAALAVAGTVTNSGTVKTASVSAVPLPSGKTWGGTVQYYNSSGNQRAVGGTFNNLIFSNTSGTQTASGNLTVNGTLTTTSGGFLNMGTYQLAGTLSTINNGGTIQTQNTGVAPIPTGLIWGGTVQFNALAGGQTAMAGTYNTLTLSNTGGTQTASGDISATTFNTTAGGTINMGTFALSVTNISHLGILRTQNTTATPFTAGLTWGGTVVFDGASGQILPASTLNNLTISNTAGVTSAANQTVNGILNLSVANPDATHGSLDMATYTLNLGANATTAGVGDVSGIISRTHAFVENTNYSFGNTNQIIVFPVVTGQTLPSSIIVKISLLSTAPGWLTDGTKRKYQMMQTGADPAHPTKALFRCNYLDTELASGVNESLLAYWMTMDGSTGNELGWSNFDISANWISLSNVKISDFPASFGTSEINIAPSGTDTRTWNGSVSVNWNDESNWTPSGVPTSVYGIVIPDAATTTNDPELPDGASGKFIILEFGSILNTISGSSLTLSGVGDVWSAETNGIFHCGTNSTIIFSGSDIEGDVSISGSTTFNNLTISSGTLLRPGPDAYTGISGVLTNNGIFAAATNHNIIEFNEDASLTIPNPNGSTPGYHSLIISGTGTKTLPSPLYIWHDFTNNGTVDAGTGTVTMGTVGILEGISTNIGGSSSTTFYNLINNNVSTPLTTTADISIGGTLTINENTTLQPGSTNTIGGTGTLTGNGTAKVTGLAAINSFCTQYLITTKDLTNLTVDYNGAGNQTVCAEDYLNLIISPNGTRTVTLASTGNIGVSGVFDPDNTLTSYIVTGSTMNANGTGSQTVPAFNYYNVNVTGDRGGGTITLVNGGTIGIAGHSTVSATNANFVITGNTIDINGSGDQNIDPFTFWNVIFSGGGIKTTSGNLTVVGSFTVESGVTLNMAASVLASPFGGSINNSGTIKTSCATTTSVTPLPTAKTWGGTIEYTGSAAQTVVAGTYNNLTMSGAGGGTTANDITVNGVLNLSQTNPSSTQGILHTGSYTLNMGESATTSGTGDVTGIVKRQHTFTDGIEYSFGNQYTSLNFLGVSGGVKPTWVSCKIEIGTAPSWRSEAINRFYSFAQSGGTDRMIVKLHYLDSELHDTETDETQLVFWDAYDPAFTPDNFVNFYPRNKNGHDATNNWVQLTGPAINYIATSSVLDVKQWGLSYTNVAVHTWIGLGSVSYPGDWSLPGHWDGGVPQAGDDVLIPGTLPVGNSGYPYRNLLSVLAPASAKTIEIEANATLNATDYNITISGDANAWLNNGTFNAGTGTVIFNNGSLLNNAQIGGTTNFYNLTAGDNTKIQALAGSIIRTAGSLTPGSGSIFDFITNSNTVEYNGSTAQTVLDPGSGYGYHNLIFSGNSTKTLPSSTLNIFGNLTVNSSITATGNTLSMEGVIAQIINGTNPASLNNLTINNAAGVTLNSDALASIRGILLINNGKIFEIAPANRLTVSGTLTNNAGSTGLVLQSEATGTASLLHETNNVPATVQRYISGIAEDWHFLSSPVSNQTIAGSDWVPAGTYGNGTGYDLYVWDEPTPCWVYYLNTTVAPNWPTVHPSANFVPGRGYLYSVQAANPTKEFAGNLNNGDQTIPLDFSSAVDSLKGFNLIGNPYPSSIDWKAVSGWTRANLQTSGTGYDMWIWNPAANNYGIFNSNGITGSGTNDVTQYIAPMQGFFVRASSAGNVVMTNSVRVHDEASNWKSAEISQKVKVRIASESGNGYDEVVLQFGSPVNEPGAAKLFSPAKSAPSSFLPYKGEVLSVLYLTNTDENSAVPLMFKPGSNGSFTLSVDCYMNDFEIFILEDKETQTFYNLKENNSYRFTASTKNNQNRFVLHFKEIKDENNHELPANIYSSGSEVVLDLTLVDDIAEVKIVDVLGRTILQKSLGGKTIHRLPVNVKSQVIIVIAKTQNAWVSKKVFVY